MFGEPFSARLKCPICGRKEPHLVRLVEINFTLAQIHFTAYCSNCMNHSIAESNEPSETMHYKCDYAYYDSIEPLEDKPIMN